MFDAQQIALDTIAGVQRHFNEIARRLFFGGLESIGADPVMLAVQPLEDSPLKHQILLLVDVANGNSHHEGEVAETLLSVTEALTLIPRHLQHADMQRVVEHVRLWLNRDELITMSEAARIIRGEVNDKTLRYVNEQVQRGRFTRYTDPDEPNPQRAGRVSRKEVEAFSQK